MTERRVGPGRVLLGFYALFVVAAGSRSAVQLLTHASRAPIAYTLSAVAAAIYLVGLILLYQAEKHPTRSRGLATGWCVFEVAGVVAVGITSLAWPAAFPDATVWSHFGSGYFFVPVLLPIIAAGWLVAGTRRGEGALVDDPFHHDRGR
ncbi:hypothetical protein GCM10009765_06580 [Fodinicola feengrottensis]|uniref:Integral membrane protein n=2 Tax=Fodinicola feengrottensis TaxID=435914 RepID=A0ABN2FUI1_9ACTN